MTSVKLALAGIAAISLLAAACSTGDSTDTTAAPSGATETTAAASGGGGDSSGGASVSNTVVKELQNTLATLEYYTGSVDGVYGPETTQAVEAFQKDAGIAVDGKYGPETHTALEKAYIETSNAWEDHKAITELQQAMSDLGYYEGAVDGLYGPETVAGIKAVQKDCGLAEDGLYGADTHACLVDLGGDA
jgi:peptidoglycan hydrolase-like protein with peptidoglycan-binding domain